MATTTGASAQKGRQKQLGARKSHEELKGWSMDPQGNEELSELALMSFEDAQRSHKYSDSSPHLMNMRNLHLSEFESFIKGYCTVKGVDFSTQRCWGAENIETNVRAYLSMMAQTLIPRSYESESIKKNSLTHRRASLMYWVPRKSPDKIKMGVIWTASSEALQYAFAKHNVLTPSAEKHYLTKRDLAGLIEHDMWLTDTPDVAHQHHLCWLLGFVCGIRPGSIGVSRGRQGQFLQWRDVEIKRTGKNGSHNFRVKLTFRWIKGWRDTTRRGLVFTCKGPRFVEDVLYSIPHRILAILLRRGYLRDHQTFESLLAGNEVSIRIKDRFLDSPVVCAGSPKGGSLQLTKPATTDAISAYVQRRAMSYGLPSGITHYAWRRSAGSKVAATLGYDKGREFLAHDPRSTAFEEAYNEGTVAWDVMSLAMGRPQESPDEILEDESLSVNRIKRYTELRAVWVARFITGNERFKEQEEKVQQAWLAADGDPDSEALSEAATVEESKLGKMERSLRTQGQKAFQKVQQELVQSNMTQDELAQRRAEVSQPGQLQQKILDAANGITPPSPTDYESVDNYDTDDLRDARERSTEIDEEIEVENLTLAVEGRSEPSSTSNARSRKEERHQATEEASLPDACKMLMEILMGQADTEKLETTCKLCQLDSTVTQEKKGQTYKPGKMAQHLATDYHSPKSVWMRKYKEQHQKCPYGCNKRFKRPTDLLKHVREDKAQSDEHLLAAAKDGLFARDFDTRETRTAKTAVRKVGDKIQKVELKDAESVPLSSIVPSDNSYRSTRDTTEFQARLTVPQPSAKRQKDAVLRLPTAAPLTQTSWWHEHKEGVFGEVSDSLQQQRRWIMEQADRNLRELDFGQADESGQTRKVSLSSGKLKKRLAALRQRLADMGWSWAEDIDNFMQPEDDEEFEGFGDEVDPAAAMPAVEGDEEDDDQDEEDEEGEEDEDDDDDE